MSHFSAHTSCRDSVRSSLQDLGVHEVQQFATDLRQTVSGKTVVNVLSTLFAVIRYADKCGMRVAKVGFADLTLGSTKRETPVPFFTREQAGDIIAAAKEPFKTLLRPCLVHRYARR